MIITLKFSDQEQKPGVLQSNSLIKRRNWRGSKVKGVLKKSRFQICQMKLLSKSLKNTNEEVNL